MTEHNEQFQSATRELVPINGLIPQYQNEIINQSEVLTFKKRQFVFKEGDTDDYSYYLLDGELEMTSQGQLVKHVTGGDSSSLYALAQLQPRQLSARASTAITVLRVDRALLDRLLTLEEQGDAAGEVTVSDIDAEESGDWMTKLLQLELFAKIPAANIQRIFSIMESVRFSAGDVVVEQGQPGDFYYFIQTGRCEVSRRTDADATAVKLAELGEGDCFGEEALVSNATRNASVIMLTDGDLMRLTKQDFTDLIKKPVLREVDYARAQALVADGARWLDVRFEDECRQGAIPGSLNIPFNTFRGKMVTLDTQTAYVICCDTGGRSSVAAFLLTQEGFDVCCLKGGLINSPMGGEPETVSADAGDGAAVRAPATAVTRADVRDSRSVGDDEPAVVEAPESTSEGSLDADIRATALDAELVRANLELEDALRQKSEAERARESIEAQARDDVAAEKGKLHAQVEKLRSEAAEAKRALARAAKTKVAQERQKLEAEAQRLREEAEAAKRNADELAQKSIAEAQEKARAKAAQASTALAEAQHLKLEIEAARHAAQAEAEHKRKEEEDRLAALKEAAEQRLRDESARLESEYARNAEEIARMQQEREAAEAKLGEERARMEAEVADAQAKLEEAKRIKKETQAARRAAEKEAERKRKVQEALEEKLRGDVNKKIQEERRKLETEFARHAHEMEDLQRERNAATAARRAAEEEAARIVAEYKEAHARTTAEQEAKLRAERERVEQESRRIKAELDQALAAKREAEATRKQVEERMAALQAVDAESASRATVSVEEASELNARMEAIDVEVNDALQQLHVAEAAHDAAQAARQANEGEMARQRGAEEELRRQLEREAQEWRKEQDAQEHESQSRDLLLGKDQMARIRARAAQAKREAQDHAQSLLGDVAAQLEAGED